MNRKEFLKMAVYGSLGAVAGGLSLLSCNKQLDDEMLAGLTKSGIENLIENGQLGANNLDYFSDKSVCIVYSKYKVHKGSTSYKQSDFFIEVDLDFFVKYNFDVQQEEYEITSVTKKMIEHIPVYTLHTNLPDKTISVVGNSLRIEYPLKGEDVSDKTILKEHYKIPCMMTKEGIIDVINKEEFTNTINLL